MIQPVLPVPNKQTFLINEIKTFTDEKKFFSMERKKELKLKVELMRKLNKNFLWMKVELMRKSLLEGRKSHEVSVQPQYKGFLKGDIVDLPPELRRFGVFNLGMLSSPSYQTASITQPTTLKLKLSNPIQENFEKLDSGKNHPEKLSISRI